MQLYTFYKAENEFCFPYKGNQKKEELTHHKKLYFGLILV